MSIEKKAREEDESDLQRKDHKSEGEDKNLKVEIFNEEKSDSYERLLEKSDGAGKGSEVSRTENINDGKSLYACKGPPTLEIGKPGCYVACWH